MTLRDTTFRLLPLGAALWCPSALASDGPYGFGIGVVAGEPSGLSLAYRPGDQWMLQAAAAWSFPNNRLHLNLDYLYNITILDAPELGDVRFPVYVGIGARLRMGDDWDRNWDGDWDHEGLGVRVPIGIALLPDRAPFDVFLEIAPALILIPATEGELDGGIGARFYF